MRFLLLACFISQLAFAGQSVYKCIDPKTKQITMTDQDCSKLGMISAGQVTVVAGNTTQSIPATPVHQQATQVNQNSGYQQSSSGGGTVKRDNDQCQRLNDEKEAIKNYNDEWHRKRYGELAYQINKLCR